MKMPLLLACCLCLSACQRATVNEEGVTAVVATHDPMMLEGADRVLELRDGLLVGDP